MSDEKPSVIAEAALIETRLDEWLKEAQSPKLPEPKPIGACPYCHFPVEEKEVRQEPDFMSTPIGSRGHAPVLLRYWGCTNEHCCVMFWRRPEAIPEPPVDDPTQH